MEADMATMTYGAVPVAESAPAASRPGLFRRFLARLMTARGKSARREVRAHLMSFDSETLARLGYDRDMLIRAGLRDYI
jgi:hypothetical protein